MGEKRQSRCHFAFINSFLRHKKSLKRGLFGQDTHQLSDDVHLHRVHDREQFRLLLHRAHQPPQQKK